MPLVSIILPSRGEQFLPQTVANLLSHARGDIEVIPVMDGYWHNPPLPADPRINVLHFGESKGMRPAINAGVAAAQGDYLLKLDAHCAVDEGFDVKLLSAIEDNWVVIPRRKSLDPFAWAPKPEKPSIDYHFLSYPYDMQRYGPGLHGSPWAQRAKDRKDLMVDDEMSSQGSCWFMTRKMWERTIGPLDREKYGNFIQEFQEVGCKAWLSGGAVKVNKSTWYAHLHKGTQFGRGYWISKSEMAEGAKFAAYWWMSDLWEQRVHDIRWLIEKFWPVPTWPARPDGSLDWEKVERERDAYNAAYLAGMPTGLDAKV